METIDHVTDRLNTIGIGNFTMVRACSSILRTISVVTSPKLETKKILLYCTQQLEYHGAVF
jgi:hypothetical protein